MYWVQVPRLLRTFYPKSLWEIPTNEKIIYLTFDDGPTPKATDFALEVLEKTGAKASFFLLGKQVKNHPSHAQAILSQGHRVANHTFHHLNGWKTPLHAYLQDVESAQKQIEDTLGVSPTYFRPPYGKITYSQARAVRTTHQIVMMNVLSGDFDVKISANTCKQNVIKYTEKGAIWVFHDSEKAFERMRFSLPELIPYFQSLGYRFDTLPL